MKKKILILSCLAVVCVFCFSACKTSEQARRDIDRSRQESQKAKAELDRLYSDLDDVRSQIDYLENK